MSMHLHHPSLSMAGKKKGKIKFASAEAKQRHLQLEQEWAMLKQQHGAQLEEKKRRAAMSAAPLTYSMHNATDRVTQKIPSKVTPGGDCAKVADKVYTGDKMIGVGQLHKSNAVPVFRTEDINDIARMRR